MTMLTGQADILDVDDDTLYFTVLIRCCLNEIKLSYLCNSNPTVNNIFSVKILFQLLKLQ